MRARRGRRNYLAIPHLNPPCRKWSKFKNDQLPGQTWSNLANSGQIWSEKDGQKKAPMYYYRNK
jgi:hypothetical protein